jgi:hypothetical protein
MYVRGWNECVPSEGMECSKGAHACIPDEGMNVSLNTVCMNGLKRISCMYARGGSECVLSGLLCRRPSR